jgi:glucuronoarabinoxylan endo-1,4-beta-xylanase
MNAAQRDGKRIEHMDKNVKFHLKFLFPKMRTSMQQRTLVALKTIALLALLSFPLAAQAQTGTATVNWIDVHQTIDGFGVFGGNFGSSGGFTTEQADFLFTTSAGIGLSLMRTEVTTGGGVAGNCSSISLSCAGPNVSSITAAATRGARVWAASWSPPASMKTNGSTICNTGSGSSSLSAGSYGAYATWLSNFIASVNTHAGVSLYAISPQNEPDACPTNYDGAAWSGTSFHDFIKTNLFPTLAANGQGNVKIMLPEPGNWSAFAGFSDSCMNDSGCAADVGILAWHDYYNHPTITNPYSGNQRFWETEASAGPGYGPTLNGGNFDPSIADGLLWAAIIHSRLVTSNANAWHWWRGVETFTDNEGLLNTNSSVNPSGVIPKHTYVLGNWSKFVRPGWVRIGATANPVGEVSVSAYKDPNSGNFVIVAINQNGTAVPLNFVLNGFTAASVTPWVTSASLDLAQQPSISAGGGAFSSTLLASSVTTFVSKLSSTPVAPPTNLSVTVH